MLSIATPMFDIEQVALRLGIDRDGVSRFIASGELPAVNVSRDRDAKRPSWRVRPEDLDAFELSRLSVKTPKSDASKPRVRSKPSVTRKAWF